MIALLVSRALTVLWSETGKYRQEPTKQQHKEFRKQRCGNSPTNLFPRIANQSGFV